MNIKSLDNVVSSIRKDYKGNEKKIIPLIDLI